MVEGEMSDEWKPLLEWNRYMESEPISAKKNATWPEQRNTFCTFSTASFLSTGIANYKYICQATADDANTEIKLLSLTILDINVDQIGHYDKQHMLEWNCSLYHIT